MRVTGVREGRGGGGGREEGRKRREGEKEGGKEGGSERAFFFSACLWLCLSVILSFFRVLVSDSRLPSRQTGP